MVYIDREALHKKCFAETNRILGGLRDTAESEGEEFGVDEMMTVTLLLADFTAGLTSSLFDKETENV